jgi:dolichyl-diphosphooligosaccharide--protein glycosyltransferase
MDPLLSYPDGALNPRPPLYDWSVAITGLILSPFAGGDVYVSTWIVMLFAPAFWGALTAFPTYLIGKEMFNKKAGLICAFLVATMPSHVERSPLGFSDHDAIVLFFVVLAFFFLGRELAQTKGDTKGIGGVVQAQPGIGCIRSHGRSVTSYNSPHMEGLSLSSGHHHCLFLHTDGTQ